MNDSDKQTKAFLDTLLNPIEQDCIATLVQNPTTMEALKKIFLAGVYYNGVLAQGLPANPTRNFLLNNLTDMAGHQLTDVELGANLRAAARGVGFLENGFAALNLYKAVEDTTKEEPNQAR